MGTYDTVRSCHPAVNFTKKCCSDPKKKLYKMGGYTRALREQNVYQKMLLSGTYPPIFYSGNSQGDL